MQESIFTKNAKERQQEQEALMASNGLINKKRNRVRLNITLPVESKEKLQRLAYEKNMSVSQLITQWISEH